MTLLVDREHHGDPLTSAPARFHYGSFSFNTYNSKILKKTRICKVLLTKITISVLSVIEGGRMLLFVYLSLTPTRSLFDRFDYLVYQKLSQGMLPFDLCSRNLVGV